MKCHVRVRFLCLKTLNIIINKEENTKKYDKKVLTDRTKADIILRHLKSGIIISYHNISFKRFEGKKKIKKC